MIANSDSSAISTVSNDVSNYANSASNSTVDYSVGSNVNNANGVSGSASSNVNSDSDYDNNVKVYAVARKSNSVIIMLLVLVDDCVSIIPRFDVSGVNRAGIVSIVKDLLVKHELSDDGNDVMVRLFLDYDSVFMPIMLNAGFKTVGEHEPLSALVNLVSDGVLMNVNSHASSNANAIDVSDGNVRVVSSGSQLFAL